MKIEEIKILRGPNYWSVRRPKLIQMRLQLEDLEQKPTNEIAGFPERLEALFPSMYSHRCSEAVAGGFFMRVKEGTWMGHVIEHIALRNSNTGWYGNCALAVHVLQVKKESILCSI